MRKIKSFFNLKELDAWYDKNLKKLTFLLFVLVFFTLTVGYIPFLNIFLTPSIGLIVFILFWYILFSPSVDLLVFILVISLAVVYSATVFEIKSILDMANLFYIVMFVLVFVNFVKNKK